MVLSCTKGELTELPPTHRLASLLAPYLPTFLCRLGSLRFVVLMCCFADNAERNIFRFLAPPVVFIRNSPATRAGFLAYLILLHLWAFVILGFHSHFDETLATSQGEQTLQGKYTG